MFSIAFICAFISALVFLLLACVVFLALFSPDDFDAVITKNEDLDARLNLETAQQQAQIKSYSAKYWCLGIVFFTVFGAMGSGDFDYKCKRAKQMNQEETCKMIAAK